MKRVVDMGGMAAAAGIVQTCCYRWSRVVVVGMRVEEAKEKKQKKKKMMMKRKQEK